MPSPYRFGRRVAGFGQRWQRRRRDTPLASHMVTAWSSRTSTLSLRSDRRAFSERMGSNGTRSRGADWTRMMRASRGSIVRKSAASALRASSAMAPAISTPVGPPPTTTENREQEHAGAPLRRRGGTGGLRQPPPSSAAIELRRRHQRRPAPPTSASPARSALLKLKNETAIWNRPRLSSAAGTSGGQRRQPRHRRRGPRC